MSDNADGLGPVEIEWIINNDKVASDLAATEKLYTDAVENIEAAATQASGAVEKLKAKGGWSDSKAEAEAFRQSLQAVGDTGEVALSGMDKLVKDFDKDLKAGKITLEQFNQEITALQANEARLAAEQANLNKQEAAQLGLLEQLKLTLADLRAQQAVLVDPALLKKTNLAIQETEAEIIKFSNSGKKGFDEFGKKVGESKSVLGLAWEGIRKIAQILPGVGIGTVVAFAAGPILEYVTALFKGKDALNQAVQNLKAYNEVQKASSQEYGKQIAPLQILYKAATDVNNSMADRIRYAQEIKASYADSFANSSTQSILNGQEA